ncbi:MAG: adenine phosphoribosyltransferase [Deltaproteobacteria bacterium]|nr:adenine phosphoribosyltransferase [Deltaproteobacteria bacterium]
MSIDTIQKLIRDVPDFPKPGILFKDITPVLQDADGLRAMVEIFVGRWRDMGIEKVVGIESRGFLIGAPVAVELGLGLGLVRKAGKLPFERIQRSYDLEYGSATLEAQVDLVRKGERVVVVDDLLATGGTARATVELVRELGGEVVECGFLIELGFLPGRQVLDDMGVPVFAPIAF